jgi:phosphoenolpyruvate synthase/pyruvate phosphate dikinase
VSQNQAHKWVYLFEEGDGDQRALLGGKGARLADMTRAGLPVQGLATQTGDLRFALDAYRRFATLFAEIVMGVAHEKLERVAWLRRRRLSRRAAGV